jgi:two-component system, cell cycle sensor histidine kinase and response regulator CckA
VSSSGKGGGKSRRSKATAVPVALLAAALRSQSEGVFIATRRVGSNGLKIIFANASFCAMTGHAESWLVGRAHGLFHVEASEIERLRVWLNEAHPKQPLVGEGHLLRADGSTIYASWSFDPLGGANGKITHVVATYRDMTEKHRLQEALVHAQRLDAVGRLAGGVAHDFNNLLSVINGYCELLAVRTTTDEESLRQLNEIHAAGRKAAALTQQLLTFSRRQPMDSRITNLSELVQENAEIMRRLLGESGRLELELDENLANVRTDPAQFQQVLLNLVLNARDALRDNGRIVVRTVNREIKPDEEQRGPGDVPPGHYAMISVTDNGTGMDRETQGHLFEPFFTTKPNGKGTGLGLALVYGVVQQSAGFIRVKSELLVGSTFDILLPAVSEPVQRAARIGTMSPFPSTRGSESVLLVERDDVVRKMVAGILTTDGYRVIAAATPADALIAARSAGRPIQLLIGNISGEGEKLARALEAAKPGLRIINVCAPETAEPLDWVSPAHQFPMSKPFALSELLTSVRRLLDTRRR